jgi:phospholipid/cholesterol/gamma-HCH transport system substrate-binding protein
MSPSSERDPVVRSQRGSSTTRAIAIGALALAVVAVAYVLLSSGDGGHNYRLQFETGGQLVTGNQVLIGGTPVGSVDSVELTDDAQAEVGITVDEELHEGSEAVIRSTSLSGIANRYVSISPGPNNAPVLEDDATITQVDTTTPVDLDQLFAAFDSKARKGLQDIIRGYGAAYAGRGEQASESYKYLNPSLVAADRLFAELSADQQVLTDFLVNGAAVTSALAERRNDLAELTSNANEGLGAIADQAVALDRSLSALPPAMRQANTTFVNLRAAFDDLDSFVAASKPATKNLAPFLRKLKNTARPSVKVFKRLRLAVRRPGAHNDLAEFTQDLAPINQRSQTSFPQAIKAEDCAAVDPTPCGSPAGSDPPLRLIRPYTPDIFGALGKLGAATAYYDGDGHYARVMSLIPLFQYNSLNEELDPFGPPAPTVDFTDIQFASAFPGENTFRRCPGGTTQPAPDLSNPFLDLGNLTSGPPPADCNATQVPPGP